MKSVHLLKGPFVPLILCSAALVFFMTRGNPVKPLTVAAPLPQIAPAPAPSPIVEAAPALAETIPVETQPVVIEQPVEPPPAVEAIRRRPRQKSPPPVVTVLPVIETSAVVVEEPVAIPSPWPVLTGEIRVLPSLDFDVGAFATLSPGEGEGTLRIQAARGKLGEGGGGCWLVLSSGTLFWEGCAGGTVISNGYRIRGEDNARFSVVRVGAAVRVVVSAGKVLISGNGESATLFLGDVFESSVNRTVL